MIVVITCRIVPKRRSRHIASGRMESEAVASNCYRFPFQLISESHILASTPPTREIQLKLETLFRAELAS